MNPPTDNPTPPSSTGRSRLDPIVLQALRCPLTRSPLVLEGDYLVAQVGGLRYPIRDGIPVLLMEEAKLPPGVESLDALKARLKTQPTT